MEVPGRHEQAAADGAAEGAIGSRGFAGSISGPNHQDAFRTVCAHSSLHGVPSKVEVRGKVGPGTEDWRQRCLDNGGECFAFWKDSSYRTLAGFSYLPRSELVSFHLPVLDDVGGSFVSWKLYRLSWGPFRHPITWRGSSPRNGSGALLEVTSIMVGHVRSGAPAMTGLFRVGGSISARGA